MSDALIRNLFGQQLIETPSVAPDMPYQALVGVELEMEDATILRVPAGWTAHADGSLRNGIELVFDGPKNGLEMYKTISSFYDAKIQFSAGPRTSTHVHVNMTDATLGQARAMLAAVYTIENALFAVVEEKRKWTGYCMPLAEMDPRKLRSIMTASTAHEISAAFVGRNQDKYYGFNVQSLRKHGTVELRYFTGGPSKEELLSWIVFCNELKKMSYTVSTKDILAIDTTMELEDFLLEYFPTWGPKLLRTGLLQSMLDSLNELASLVEEASAPEREDTLVFISPTLITYLENKLLTTTKQKEALHSTLANMSVLSYSEFSSLLRRALSAEATEPTVSREYVQTRRVASSRQFIDTPLFVQSLADTPEPLPTESWDSIYSRLAAERRMRANVEISNEGGTA